MVDQIDSAGQLALYLQIARKSIIDGKPDAALFAARKAILFAAGASAERGRSTLYELAALILTHQYEKGVHEFNSVDASRLPKQDVELKGAVASLAKLIGDGPGEPRGPFLQESTEPAVASNGESLAAASAAATIDDAQHRLGQVDEVLKRKAP